MQTPANRIEIGHRTDNGSGYQVSVIVDNQVKAFDVAAYSQGSKIEMYSAADTAVLIASDFQGIFVELPIWINPNTGLTVSF